MKKLLQVTAALAAAAALAPVSAGAQGRLPLSRIAFGSCADQVKPQPIWDAILAYQPELFIFAGDNVYVEFITDAADVNQIQIPYGTAPTARPAAIAPRISRASRIQAMRARGKKAGAQRLRRSGSGLLAGRPQ